MDAFEEVGYWWPAGTGPDDAIPGILKYDPSFRISLELLGTFYELNKLRHLPPPEIIHGVTRGKKFTLYRCVYAGGGFAHPGFDHSSYEANYLLAGHHFDKPESIRFNRIRARYHLFEHWTGLEVFKGRPEYDEHDFLRSDQITYSPHTAIEARIGPDKLRILATYLRSGDVFKELTLKHASCVEIAFSESITLDEFRERLNLPIQNFLTLALGRPTSMIHLEGRSENAVDKNLRGERVDLDIEILFSHGEIPSVPESLREDEMLFTLSDIQSDFPKIVNNLIAKEEVLRPINSLYFAVMNSSSIHPDHLFLTLTRALESYHRRIFGGHFVDQIEYEPIKDALEAAIPEGLGTDFYDNLRSRIKYGNEYSLRGRLKDLLNRFGGPCSVFIADPREFTKIVVCTRNYLTHFDEDDKPCAKTGIDLYWIAHKLLAVLDICLMNELGFSSKRIESLIARNRRYQYLKEH